MTIERRPFGRTGHLSSAVIFGAAALWDADRATADRVLDLLLEHGVNHIDTAPRYGRAEELTGPWLDRHRQDFFLATKTRSRDDRGAREDLARSIDRLRTDRIDLIQLHALIHPDDWERAMGPGGALEALVEARDAGLVRFIGVTGHGWSVAAMHRRSLDRFPFDSVLLPWNWFCARHETYAADFLRTRAICRERGVAVQTIKALARGAWAAGAARTHTTWYEPITDPAAIRDAVAFILAEDDLFLNSVGDVALLPQLLEAAHGPLEAPSPGAMTAMAERQGLASIFGI